MAAQQHPLFARVDWFSASLHRRQSLQSEVSSMEANKLLNTSVDDLCAYLCKRYSVDVPVLRVNDILVDQREAQIDFRSISNPRFHHRGPQYVDGTIIEIMIPFDGDEEVFTIRPTV